MIVRVDRSIVKQAENLAEIEQIHALNFAFLPVAGYTPSNRLQFLASRE